MTANILKCPGLLQYSRQSQQCYSLESLSARPLIANTSKPLTKSSGIIASEPFTILCIFIYSFHGFFFGSLTRFKYLPLIFFDCSLSGLSKWQSPQFGSYCFSLIFFPPVFADGFSLEIV